MWIIVLLILFIAPVPTQATPTPIACPKSRLTVGEWARVTYDHRLNVRPTPSTQQARIGEISTGKHVELLELGPCADGYWWWQIEFDGRTGWIAEGATEDQAWLEPRGLLALQTDPDQIERLYRVDQDGTPIERADCMRPPDDYTRARWGFATFNRRTIAMLEQAQRIYTAQGGLFRLEDQVVQGSYTPGLSASFGTHDGGGAIDLSVRDRDRFAVMNSEILPLLDALRTAGFAAWLRAPNELYAGSAIHIHAIAIGDQEASEAARAQMDGVFGYLRGFNGLPQPEGQDPIPDAYGDPVICEWMIADGFPDQRAFSD